MDQVEYQKAFVSLLQQQRNQASDAVTHLQAVLHTKETEIEALKAEIVTLKTHAEMTSDVA